MKIFGSFPITVTIFFQICRKVYDKQYVVNQIC